MGSGCRSHDPRSTTIATVANRLVIIPDQAGKVGVMSVRMMAKVWELDLPQPLKLLALALADTGNDDGENIWPSKGYLAWKVCASSRTVQRQLNELERRGIVEIVAEKGHRLPSGQWTRLLKLHPERGDRLAPLVRKRETPTVKRGDTGDQKGRHSSVSLSVSYPLDNQDDFSSENGNTDNPRLAGESHIAYFRRLAKELDLEQGSYSGS